MNIFKKSLLSIGTTFGSLALFANQTLAAGSSFFDNPQGGAATPNAAAQGTLGDNITLIINYFLGLLGLIAVAFLIYAGILMVTAGGEEGNVEKAKKIITFAVIGIVIIVLSYTIVGFIANILG